MDASNWKPTRGASDAVGDFMEIMPLLRADSLQRIMDTLKRNITHSRDEALQELEKMAVRFEEEIYTAARSQSDYASTMASKMQTIKIRSQDSILEDIQSNFAAYSVNPSHTASLDSQAQTGNPNCGDWQEEVYQKILAMRDLYLRELNEIHQKALVKLQQFNSLPRETENEPLEKFKVVIKMLERLMQFLQIPKQAILASYNDRLGKYEKQIVNIINSWRQKAAPKQQMDTRKRNLTYSGDDAMQESKKMAVRFEEKMYTAATSQSDYAPEIALKIQTVPIKSENSMADTMQSNSAAYSSNLSYPDSTSQTGNLNNGDWQEEVYQKILAMRDLHLSDLNKVHQKFLAKLQQYDSLPHQPNNEKVEKLKKFSKMVERFMKFLQIPKHAILASYADKMGNYEKQIVYIINFYRQNGILKYSVK